MSIRMLPGSKVRGFKNTTALIICNILLQVHNGRLMPKDIIQRSRPWVRLFMLQTIRTEGLVTGTAHGSVVEGPDGNLWQFYTIVLSNPPGGRRIGMDRITFDRDGYMSVEVTDTPQWAPNAISDPAKGNSGSIPVTINKIRAMNALSKFSSEQRGHEAAYAVDNSSGTWWEPAPTDTLPNLTIELSPATRFDVVQLFNIDGVRLMFNGGRRGFGRPSAATAPAQPASDIYQYIIEVSMDGKTYVTALDQTRNNIS